jgi:hypothetical protein
LWRLVINLKTAKALGVELPPTLIARPEKAMDTFNHCLTALRLLWAAAGDVHI